MWKQLKWTSKNISYDYSLKIPFHNSFLPIHLILTVIRFFFSDTKSCLNYQYHVVNLLCFEFLVLVFLVNLTNANQLITTNKLWCFVHIVVIHQWRVYNRYFVLHINIVFALFFTLFYFIFAEIGCMSASINDVSVCSSINDGQTFVESKLSLKPKQLLLLAI